MLERDDFRHMSAKLTQASVGSDLGRKAGVGFGQDAEVIGLVGSDEAIDTGGDAFGDTLDGEPG